MKRISTYLLVMLAAFALQAQAQVSFKKAITVTSSPNSQVIEVGVNPGNTVGVDVSATAPYDESQLPPLPPSYNFDARCTTLPGRVSTYPTGLGTGVIKDIRPWISAAQVDSFKIVIAGGDVDANGATISWPSDLNLYGTSWTLKPQVGTAWGPVNMLTSTSIVIPTQGGTINAIIIKVGASAPSPGPTFAASPNPLSFGAVTVGSTNTLNLVVSNTGSVNTLNVTSVDTSLGGQTYFWVGTPPNPAGFSIAPSSSNTYQIAFRPIAGGVVTESVIFAHNGTSSPDIIDLSGTGVAQGGTLEFDSTARVRNDLTSGIADSVMLRNWIGQPLRSLQFKIINVGNASGPLTRLTGVSRGERIRNTAKWVFQYEIGHGPIQPDLSSVDTIRVVILGVTDSITAGSSTQSLVKFTYSTVDITDSVKTTKFSFGGVLGSTWSGMDANVLVGTDQDPIQILDRGVGLKGDTNGDGSVDILDLLQVIDHILFRITLVGQQFIRSDVNPWPVGNNVLDARDVAVIQNMILSGVFPDGVPIPFAGTSVSHASKVGVNNLVFDVQNDMVVVSLESSVPVKGVQFDVANANVVSLESQMQNVVGSQNSDAYRGVLYQNSGSELPAGKNEIARIPVSRFDGSIDVRNVSIADARNNRINANVIVRKAGASASQFELLQNYPNPFNPSTMISFSVASASDVRLSIVNALGQEVRTLVNGNVEAGTHSITWNGSDNSGNSVPSGMYMYRLQSGAFNAVRTMTLSK